MSTAVDKLAERIQDTVCLAVTTENLTLMDAALTLLTSAVAILLAAERAKETAALLSTIAKRLEGAGSDAFEGRQQWHTQ